MIKRVIFVAGCTAASLCFSGDNSTNIEPSLVIMHDSELLYGDYFTEDNASSDNYWKRIRFGFKVNLFDTTSIKFSSEYDEEDNVIKLKDLYLKLPLSNRWDITLGRFKPPPGMENDLSTKWQPFLERSVATQAFSFGRENGTMITRVFGDWTLNAGIFFPDKEGSVDHNPIAYTARLFHAFEPAADVKLHWGIGSSKQNPYEEITRIESPLLNNNYGKKIRTQKLRDATSLTLFHQEIALGFNKIVFKAENFQQHTRTISETHRFNGYYASTNWNILGKGYRYKDNNFLLKRRKKPSIELAVRYSEVDLESFGEGDTASSWNIELSAYWLQRYKIALEYEMGRLNEFDNGVSETIEGSTIGLRLQILLD